MQLMAFEYGWTAFKSVYFIGHIIWGVLMLSYVVHLLFCRSRGKRRHTETSPSATSKKDE
jgi:hypothetical protein